MKNVGLLLDNDTVVTNKITTHSHIYSTVKRFVEENNLQNRKLGSKLGFWVNFVCDGNVEKRTGYLFEVTVQENLVDCITDNIIHYFGNTINDLVLNNCEIVLDHGL